MMHLLVTRITSIRRVTGPTPVQQGCRGAWREVVSIMESAGRAERGGVTICNGAARQNTKRGGCGALSSGSSTVSNSESRESVPSGALRTTQAVIAGAAPDT
jgi:hypothetical protein